MKNSEKRRLRRRGCTVIRSHISAIKRKQRTAPKGQESSCRLQVWSGPLFLDTACLYSTLLPQAGRQLELCGRTSRESHPSEDLSELSPLLETVAGQGYHYRQMRSWRNRLPCLLLDRRTRWAPYWPSLIGEKEKHFLFVFYRWSSRTVHIARSSLMLFSCRIFS